MTKLQPDPLSAKGMAVLIRVPVAAQQGLLPAVPGRRMDHATKTHTDAGFIRYQQVRYQCSNCGVRTKLLQGMRVAWLLQVNS